MGFKEEKASLVLLAGGIGSRAQSPLPKQFVGLGEQSIVEHALEPFLNESKINVCVIVCKEEYRSLFFREHLQKRIIFAEPGKRRQDSLENGLLALGERNPLVFVHDAARPFFNAKYFDALFDTARSIGASALGIPVSSTLKRIGEDQMVQKSVDRSKVWEVQTPQVAFKQDLLKALKIAKDENKNITDESSLMQLISQPVKLVEGDSFNFKVTQPKDIELAKILANEMSVDEKIST